MSLHYVMLFIREYADVFAPSNEKFGAEYNYRECLVWEKLNKTIISLG